MEQTQFNAPVSYFRGNRCPSNASTEPRCLCPGKAFSGAKEMQKHSYVILRSERPCERDGSILYRTSLRPRSSLATARTLDHSAAPPRSSGSMWMLVTVNLRFPPPLICSLCHGLFPSNPSAPRRGSGAEVKICQVETASGFVLRARFKGIRHLL